MTPLLTALLAAGAALPPPIIDMHLHAHSLRAYGGVMRVCAGNQAITFPGLDPRRPMTIDDVAQCANKVESPATDEAVLSGSLEMLRRYNIRAVTAGPLEIVEAWRAADPDRIIPAQAFSDAHVRSPEDFRRLHGAGRFRVFAEITAQCRGLGLDDPAYEPFFALAEELDIPVARHHGR